MWNRSIALPIRRHQVQNTNGFANESWDFIRGVPASFRDATRADVTLANQCGYKAEVVVEVLSAAYNGASFFVDEATKDVYDVKRSYRADKSMMVQLTAERRERGKI